MSKVMDQEGKDGGTGGGTGSDAAAKAAADAAAKASQEALIREARTMGHMPKDIFVKRGGDPDKWVDEATFVQRGREMVPLLKKDLTNMREKLTNTEAELAELRKTSKEYGEFVKKGVEAEWKKKYDELKDEYAKAVDDGDGKKAAATLEAMDEHKDNKPAPAKTDDDGSTTRRASKAEDDPDFKAWLDDNRWYRDDPDLQTSAVAIAISIAKKDKLKGRALYDKVSERMSQLFPEEMEGYSVGSSDTGGASGRRLKPKGNGRSFEDLPQEAQEACDRFVRQGMCKNREQYLSNYVWDK